MEQEVLGHDLLGSHVGDADQREYLVGFAGRQKGGRQLQRVGGYDVVVGEPVHEQQRARELVGGDRYVEVFVDTPIEVCRERDEHGLYEAADRGEIPQFPGVSATYDRPTDTDLRIDTVEQSVEQCVDVIIELLDRRGFLRGEPGDV